MSRQAGKLGRRAPKNAPALLLRPLLTGVLPEHPMAVDHLASLSGWQMLGNDTYGDCVAVTWANVRRLMTALVGSEQYPNLTQVIEFYKTQNPNFPSDDNGMDIQTALEDLVRDGGPDGVHAVAFARVNVKDPEEIKAAISIFGYVWVGINVQQAQMQQFNAGQPWDYVQGSQNEGGHSIITGGYDSDKVGADERFITWAEETGFTDEFWAEGAEEAWVCIWPEHLQTQAFQEGIDQQKLAEAYQTITGRPFPVQPAPPGPDPEPTPEPPAPPVGLDQQFAAAATTWLTHHPHHVGKSNDDLRIALETWLEGKGLT